MKQACSNFSALVFATALLLPASLLAQKEEKEKEVKDKKDVEQIIITRKGDKNEKVIVEITGDKITVNGKSIDELKDGDVTVRRNRIRDTWAYAEGLKEGTFFAPNKGYTFFNVDSNRAMLGVSTERTEEGAVVRNITKGSGAEKAGIKEGDVIVTIDDKKIEDPDDLSTIVKKHKPGEKLNITYLRDKKQMKTTAELGKWNGYRALTTEGFKMDMEDLGAIMPNIKTVPSPRVPMAQGFYRSSGPRLGLSVQDTDDGKGVKVLEVDEESNAEKAGIKENDILTEIDGKAVNSADEVAKIIRESKDKQTVKMKLKRGSKTETLEVKIPRKLKTADL